MSDAHIVCIIDRSGSMMTIRDDAIGGFNAFLKEQKKQPGKARMTFVQFDNEYEPVFTRKALGMVSKLDTSTFQPRGMTALYDAIGRTLNGMDAKDGEKVIVAILTDGQENASKEWTSIAVKNLIDSKREQGFEFIYLGANQDAFSEASKIGVRAADTHSFAATGAGVQDAYTTLSNTVSDYRSGVSNDEA